MLNSLLLRSIMAKKYYAIKKGFDISCNKIIENQIIDSWAECLKYVKGVKGAVYKSFENLPDANKYLIEGSKLLKKGEDKYPLDCLHVYVDGSYNDTTEKYAYGVVAVKDNIIEYISSDSARDNSKANIRQIAGELEGAVKGVEYALSRGEEKVVIFHDYEGVSHHATGLWERKEQSSIDYFNKMNELINKGIKVIFVKVDSHTGDLYNELVDEKCKEKLSIQSDKTIEKWLTKNTINVGNEDVKQEILKIAPLGNKNIIIKNADTTYNEEESELHRFEGLVTKHLVNPVDSNKSVDNLSNEDRKKFIIYLLERISR